MSTVHTDVTGLLEILKATEKKYDTEISVIRPKTELYRNFG